MVFNFKIILAPEDLEDWKTIPDSEYEKYLTNLEKKLTWPKIDVEPKDWAKVEIVQGNRDSAQEWLKFGVYYPLIWGAKGEIFIPTFKETQTL